MAALALVCRCHKPSIVIPVCRESGKTGIQPCFPDRNHISSFKKGLDPSRRWDHNLRIEIARESAPLFEADVPGPGPTSGNRGS